MNHTDYLQPILILLASGILGVSIVQKFKLSPIIGYFLAGLVLGPFGIGWIPYTASIESLAEVGVAFLLFDIGIHLSFRTLWESRRDFLGLGPIQIFGSASVIGLLAYWFLGDIKAAFVIGCGLSLSSTAIVMQGLKESREQSTPLARSALAVLIAQDIFVVFLLILLPKLAQSVTNLFPILSLALLKALGALLAVMAVGRFLLRPIFEWITSTKNSEVFTASALLFVLLTSWLVSQLGLSLPLGAFLAGLALSESDFCYLVKTEIYPFRGLLLGLFFITVGMSLNWPLALQYSGTVLGLLAGLLAVKSLTLWAVARLSRHCQGFSIRLGLLLAQGSEFAFVLLSLASAQGILSWRLAQLLQVSVGLSLALTPALLWLGRWLSQRIEQGRVEEVQSTYNPDAPKVIITGFDEIGQEIAKILEAEGIDYIAYDGDRDRIALARSKGFQVGYADMNRPKTATAVSVGDAMAVIVLIEDLDVSLYLVDALKAMNTNIPIYTVTYDQDHYQQVLDRNVENILFKNHDTAREITSRLMRHLLYSDEQIENRLERMARDQSTTAPQVV